MAERIIRAICRSRQAAAHAKKRQKKAEDMAYKECSYSLSTGKVSAHGRFQCENYPQMQQ
jgi:hypothetical protein